MTVITQRLRTRAASEFINLDTYTRGDHLIFSKADGDKSYVGRTYAATPLVGGGSEFANVIVNALKALPDDSVIQVSLICEPDEQAAQRFARGKHHGGEVITELIERQTRLIGASTHVGWRSDLPALNVRRLLISAAHPIRRIDPEAVEDAAQLHTEFLTNLKGCGFSDARPLSAAELVAEYRHLADIFRPRAEVELDELVELRHQVYGPDESFDFRAERIGVINENTCCAAVTCKAYPSKVYHGLMNLVSGAPFNSGATATGGGQRILTPYVLTTTIRVADQREEHTRVDRAIASRQQRQQLPFKLGSEDPAAKLADLLALQQLCSAEGNKFVYASTVAFVYGRSQDDVIQSSATLRATLDKLGFDARIVANNALVRWAQTLPLNFSPRIASALACESVMPAASACCLLPVYGDHLGNVAARARHSGTFFFTRRGSAYWFDAFNNDSNACGVIAARPGSGKSFVAQYLIECELAQGGWVFALDSGRSLKKFCRAVGGEFNEFGEAGDGYRPSLNPFSGLTDDEFDAQHETITSLLLMMAYDNEPIGAGARIALGEAVKAAWSATREAAGIEEVVEALKSTQASGAENHIKSEVVLAATSLIPRLTAFIESPARGQYFRGQGTLDARSRFTVFELGSLTGDPHLRKCVLFFVLNLLLTRIKSIPGRKMILVDEAHDLLKDPGAESVMEGIYLKCRKDKVSAWIIVQSLLKLTDMPAGRVMLDMCEWKAVLAQSAEEIDKLRAQKVIAGFDGDDYFWKSLKSVETRKGDFSEILLYGTRGYEVVRLYVDRFTSTLFSTEDEAREKVFALMDTGVSALDAVRRVMGDTRTARVAWLRSIVAQLRREDAISTAEIRDELGEALQ